MRWTGREKKEKKKKKTQLKKKTHNMPQWVTWPEKRSAQRRAAATSEVSVLPLKQVPHSERVNVWDVHGGRMEDVTVLLLSGAAVKPHFSCTSFRRKLLLTHSKAGGTTHNKRHSAESVLTRATSLLCTAAVAKHLRVTFCRVNRVFLLQSVALFFGPDPQ